MVHSYTRLLDDRRSVLMENEAEKSSDVQKTKQMRPGKVTVPDPARLWMPKLHHHKLPVTVAKIHAACSRSHQNVLVIVIQLGNLILSKYKRLEIWEF